MPHASDPAAVFVYGTLQRGQVRAACWPARPQRVEEAWTRGRLFGRRDYPAMIAGPDRVAGELWSFAASQMPSVLEVLDAIEGTNQPGETDLYHRVVVEIFSPCGDPLGEAFTYHYASDPAADGFHPIEPGETEDTVSWP